jgi:hypothetical protein
MPEMIQIMASNCRKTYLKQYRHVVFKGWLGYSENITEIITSGKRGIDSGLWSRQPGAVGGYCVGILGGFV